MIAPRPLADAPGWVDTLAAWHHAQWQHLYADWTLAAARDELADHAGRRGVPNTLVLEDEEVRLLGSVSVIDEDAPELATAGVRWLASLYVRPDARGRGHGAMLVRAAVALAAREGVEHLHLFTPEHADFYARLGWREHGRAVLAGTPVTLMDMVP